MFPTRWGVVFAQMVTQTDHDPGEGQGRSSSDDCGVAHHRAERRQDDRIIGIVYRDEADALLCEAGVSRTRDG